MGREFCDSCQSVGRQGLAAWVLTGEQVPSDLSLRSG